MALVYLNDVEDFTRLFNLFQDLDLLREVVNVYDNYFDSNYGVLPIVGSSIEYTMSNLRYELCVGVFFDDVEESNLNIPLRYLHDYGEIENDAKIVKNLKERQKRALNPLKSME